MAEQAYTINKDGIAHEILEGEAILINFKTGSYYSLDGIGGIVWEYLCAGPASASTLAAVLAPGFSIEASAMHRALVQFLDEMTREELLAPTDQEPALLASRPTTERQSFEPPVLRKYSDLEALLLLDPIHDVVVSGWPNAKQNPS